jgi:hypothetical protein
MIVFGRLVRPRPCNKQRLEMSCWLVRRLVLDGTVRVCRTAQRVEKRRPHTDVLAEPRT